MSREKYHNVAVGEGGQKVYISCHNVESHIVLLPFKITTGNVNLNKKSPSKWRGFIVDIFIIQEWVTTLDS